MAASPPLSAQPVPKREPEQDRICVFGEEYVYPHDVIFAAKQRHWTMADRWEVQDTDGTVHFKVEDKIIELHDKKTLVNAHGTVVCTAIEKVLTFHGTTFVCKGRDRDWNNAVMRLKSKIRTRLDKMEVFFQSNDTDTPDLVVAGNFYKWKFNVYSRNRNKVVEVTYDPFAPKGWYGVNLKVTKGMDAALAVILMVMCFEIMMPPPDKPDENNGGGGGDDGGGGGGE